MNLQELRDETRRRIGETTEQDFFADVEIDLNLNEGLKRFSNEERWPWLYADFETTTTEGEDELELPDNIALNRVFGFNISDQTLAGGQMLERVEPMEGFRLRHAHRDREAVPRYYYISKSNLVDDSEPPIRYTAKLIPAPDAAYEITGIYLIVPPLLSGNEDEPAMPEEYQGALPAYAAGMLFLKELDISQKAGEQFAIYNSILENAVRETKRFDADEVVAWARSKPSGRRWGIDFYMGDVRSRLPATLGD